MREPGFWQALLSLDLSARKFRELLKEIGPDCRTAEELSRSPALSPKQREAIQQRFPLPPIPEDVRVLPMDDPAFPENVRLSADPPPALFVRGSLEPRDALAVAIVGTRKASPYGQSLAMRLAKELASAGITVVSGAAYGIDAAAHKGALEAGGRTIAVLGCGVDRAYPSSHRSLLDRIASSGAVVSQFPIGTPPDAFRFPSRNFVIASLSRAIIVVEAPAKSGALITAVAAVEEGRHVFVCPAPMDAESHYGGFALVNEGATLLYDVGQVLEVLGIEGDLPTSSKEEDLSESQKRILEMIGGVPVLADTISDTLDLPSSQVLAELTQLELMGKVARLGGGFVRS